MSCACRAAQRILPNPPRWRPRPPAAPDYNHPRSIPRRCRAKSPQGSACPAEETAAARRSDGGGRSSRDLPGGAVLAVLEHHAHFRKLVADAVGLGEILGLAGGVARGDTAL